MMERWLGSRAKVSTFAPSAVLSVLAHGAVVIAAVLATADADVAEEVLEPNIFAQFLAPPNRLGRQEYQPEMIRYASVFVPEAVLHATLPEVTQTSAPPVVSGPDLFDAPEVPELPAIDSVFSVVDVDSAASRYEWSAAPVFPPNLLAARISGFVRAQWVVDELGVPDTLSVKILESTHPDFTKAVTDALPYMRFRPAKIGNRAVRQRVEQGFTFRINTPPPDTVAVPDTANSILPRA